MSGMAAFCRPMISAAGCSDRLTGVGKASASGRERHHFAKLFAIGTANFFRLADTRKSEQALSSAHNQQGQEKDARHVHGQWRLAADNVSAPMFRGLKFWMSGQTGAELTFE